MRMWLAGIGIVVIAVAALAAVYMVAPSTQVADLDLARSKPTSKGLYTVSIAPDDGEPTVGPLTRWTVTLKDRSGTPVSGATFKVGGGMPDHNHGLPTQPEVTADLGDGRYRLEGMKFSMPGWWVLRLSVEAPAGADEVLFNLKL
jgi:hypothetical protein